MRFWYVGDKREHLLNTPTMALFAATLAVLLVWLLPRDGQFRDMLATPQSDLVALRYAELMAQRSPDDSELSYLLAFQYFNLGRLEDALETLRRIPAMVIDTRTRMLQLEILERLYFASSNDSRKQQLALELSKVLVTVRSNPYLVPEQRREIARLALAFEQPEIAADQYAWLADHGAVDELLAAGRFALQAGTPESAAAYFERAVEAGLGGDAFSGALTAYQAIESYEPGIALIQRQLDDGAIAPVDFFRVAQFLQAAQAFVPLRQLVAQTRDYPYQGDELSAWVDVAVSAGAVEVAALRIPELLDQHGDDPQQRLRIAQLYTWTNQAPAAFEHWRWLSRNAPELADLTETLRLAQLTYRFDAIIELLTGYRQERTLTDTERDLLLSAQLQIGDPDAALGVLEDHLAQEPEDRDAWNLGADILLADERFEQALNWWDRMSGTVPLTEADLLAIARTHWIRFEHGRALETYLAVNQDALEDPVDYWQSIAELAWTLGERRQTAYALTELAELTELDARQYGQLIASLDPGDVDRRRFFAYDAWQRTRDPRYLLSALADSFDVDRTAFERMLAVATGNIELFEDITLYWILNARHHQRNGASEFARKSFDRAIALAPRDPVTIEQALWYLVDAQDRAGLTAYLPRFSELAASAPRLARPVAAGYALLGEHALAADWYAKAYAAQPQDHDIGLGYAEALLASGRPDPAYRLRNHLLRQLLTENAALTTSDVYVLRQASLGLLSVPQFSSLLPALTTTNRGAVFNTVMGALLDARHIEGLRAVRELTLASGERVDPYIDFYLALNGLKSDELESFRTAAHTPTRAEALASLGERGEALYVALNGIDDRVPTGDRNQLRRFATDLQFADPYGVQAMLTQQDLGGIELTRSHLRFGQPTDGGHVESLLSASEFDASEALNQPLVFQQNALETRYRHAVQQGEWSATVLAVDGDIDSWVGLGLEARRRVDSRLEVSLRTRLRGLAEQTPYLQMLGRRDSLGTGLNVQASNADTLTLAVDHHRFEDQWGQPIGRGTELLINHEHALWFDAPSLRLVNSFYALTADRENRFGTELGGLLSDIRPQDVLPDELRRVATGLVLQRGDPTALNRRVASPHYRLGAFAAYQWPEDAGFSFNLDASIGTAVFGRDLLRIGVSYASQPLAGTGQSGLVWTINYSYRMGQ